MIMEMVPAQLVVSNHQRLESNMLHTSTYMCLVSSSSQQRRWSYGEIIVDGRSANCLFTSSRAARCRSWHLLRTRYCIASSAVARIRIIARHPVRRMPTDVTAAVRLITEYSLKPRSCGCERAGGIGYPPPHIDSIEN